MTNHNSGKMAAIILAFATALIVLFSTACSPAALEAKRLADQCNATYGFNSAKSLACMDTNFDRVAMADANRSKGL